MHKKLEQALFPGFWCSIACSRIVVHRTIGAHNFLSTRSCRTGDDALLRVVVHAFDVHDNDDALHCAVAHAHGDYDDA